MVQKADGMTYAPKGNAAPVVGPGQFRCAAMHLDHGHIVCGDKFGAGELILGLRPEQVRIIPSAVGGGFGGKLDLSVHPLMMVEQYQSVRAKIARDEPDFQPALRVRRVGMRQPTRPHMAFKHALRGHGGNCNRMVITSGN